MMNRKFTLPAALNSPTWLANHENLKSVFGFWLSAGYLTLDNIVNADIIDLGGGGGSLSLVLLEMGAKSCKVVDPGLNEDYYNNYMAGAEGLSFFKGTLAEFHKTDPDTTFDLVIASSVTEHIIDLASCLYDVHKVLKVGGSFYTAHDNYYHPCGMHDGYLLQFDRGGYRYQGPECWNTVEKCSFSAEFRSTIATHSPWAWGEIDESSLTPQDCSSCRFFKRTKPWAHLLYADEFTNVYQGDFFSSGRRGSGLNKITPFMLKQFIIEAGLKIEVWKRHEVSNEVPPELLVEPHCHNAFDLKTINIIARAIKSV